MIAFLSRNLIATLVIGALVLGGMWYFFSSGGDDEELLTTTIVAEENPAERGIVDTLLTLRAVSLSGTIFSDPVFRVLRDFGSEIIPEPTGRTNPFAPRDAQSAAAPAAGTQTIAPQR